MSGRFHALAGPLIYVDGGARGDSANGLVEAIPGSRYVGFEPDAEECARLSRAARPGYAYYPVALGARAEDRRTLYITRNPACSSFFRPNAVFWGQFLDCAPQIEVKETREVRTVALDDFLPGIGVERADFLELDTQGSELEILQGAEKLLSSTIIGLRVETEFAPMYQDQPLFPDVDVFVRGHGFMLFDLSRHRYRRQNCPRTLVTRGQLLYGHALYLKDYRLLAKPTSKASAVRLAFVADFLGFHDYSVEVLDHVLQTQKEAMSEADFSVLEQARATILSWRQEGRLARVMSRLKGSRGEWLLRWMGATGHRIVNAHSRVTDQRKFSWSD